MQTRVKTPEEIESMRVAGKMLGTVLGLCAKKLKPGMTTKDLADIAASELKKLGGQPSFWATKAFQT